MTNPAVAIVTGAAHGIGAAIAKRLLVGGYKVAAIDCDRQGLDRFCETTAGAHGQVLPIVWDLADVSLAQSTVEQVMRQFGRVDLLVNNAAWRELATMREITLESWERTLRICLTAPAFLAREAARFMANARRGVIINIGSMMASQAGGFAPAYIACKGAIESLTFDLAALYGPSGIRVVTISPGPIDANLSSDFPSHPDASADLRRYAQSMTMIGRVGTPDEVAALVAWAASDEASYLTGTTITLDGGWSRHHLPTPLVGKLFGAPSE